MRMHDPSTWARYDHYRHFRAFALPWFDVCAPVDISGAIAWARSGERSIARTLVWLATAAANDVPELRMRLRGESVVEHDVVHPSFTIAGDDGAFNYCPATWQPDADAFLAHAESSAKAQAARKGLDLAHDSDDRLYLTSLPWLSFTQVSHPMRGDRDDAVPRIAWGRVRTVDGRSEAPLGLQVHHALVDGHHVAKFFAAVEAHAGALGTRAR